MYFIQGVFFHRRETLSIPLSQGGELHAPVGKGVWRTVFSGSIWHPADHPDKMWLVGVGVNRFNPFELINIGIGSRDLRFSMGYLEWKGEIIHSQYAKSPDGLWRGRWKSDGTLGKEGESNCVLTEVPNDFMAPKRVPVPA